VIEGLVHFGSRGSASLEGAGRTPARQTAAQQLKAASAAATGQHPASRIPAFDKAVALAADLGLLWRDVEPINQALGVESIGSAAHPHAGTLIPNVLTWQESAPRFQETLWRVYRHRVDSSGFVTIASVRGGVGRELRLSAPVVDSFLCLTREAGERGDAPVTIEFEPNDDLLYAADRRPLIWRDSAFDFVEVHRSPDAVPTSSRSSARRQAG
jgi:hypothetical protein